MSWVDTDSTLSANSDQKISSQRAIKEYIDVILQRDATIPIFEFYLTDATYLQTKIDFDFSYTLNNDELFVFSSGLIMCNLVDYTENDNTSIVFIEAREENEKIVVCKLITKQLTKLDIGLSNVDNSQQIPMSWVDDDTSLSANSDYKIPTQHAVKTYVGQSSGSGGSRGLFSGVMSATAPTQSNTGFNT